MDSKHPKHGFIYPVNFGYVPNTISGDSEELDQLEKWNKKEVNLTNLLPQM